MFSHVMVGANDVAESKKFYDATLEVLGHRPGRMDPKGRCMYAEKSGLFMLTKPIDGEPATHGNGTTLGFAASSPEMVDAWHEAGLKAGGKAIEDPPGIREGGGIKLYLAYLRDPSGNKICALHRVA
ncbi:VOC family protein [Kordiimonas lacus]|uniref:Catechol 2,3-dioxygenase n=1 Tax=Kordiimonas lacus TaxID=637679 RepID=A0A1G6TKR4_9PROT|nr:VOC family protein [Kordiimonas lacus]SDD29619.1 Catechol 2,3-dioxygenase [Kordiimonas lacus]